MRKSLRAFLYSLLRRNVGYKILSLAISILLYVVANDKIVQPTTRDVYVQPDVIGLSDDMVVKAAPTGFTLSVSGPRAVVEAYKAQQSKAVVDTARARPGVNKLPISYRMPAALEVDGAPQVTEVVLEKKANQTFFIDVMLDNDAPSGYTYSDPLVRPRKVTVYGVASEVARVGRIIAQVSNTDTARAVDADVTLTAQDLKHEGVDSVQIDPPRVHVSADLKKAQASKAMLLSAAMTGSPAPGFAVVGYTFSPSMLLVMGTQEMLASRSSLTVTVPIDGIMGSETRSVKVSPPAGMVLRNASDGLVRVHLEVRRLDLPASPQSGPTGIPTPSAAPSAVPITIPAPPP